MTYDLFYAGIGGALLGLLLSTLLAYRFQRIIHKEQLEAQKKINEELIKSLNNFGMINALGGESLRKQLHTELGELQE